VKFWEVIADNLSKAGWSWGCVATVDSNGQTIFVPDAHRDNGKRFIVTATKNGERFSSSVAWARCLGIREIGLVFSRVVRSKLRQCGNLREDARENVGAQNFVLDIWDYLLAS
jgi:hypothetical protein